MKRCATCRFWSTGDHVPEPRSVRLEGGVRRYGVCMAATLDDRAGSTAEILVVVGWPRDRLLMLKVGDDFGCVRHEKGTAQVTWTRKEKA